MPNVLIHYDQSGHNSALREAGRAATALTALLAAYQPLALPALTTADLPGLLHEPEATLFDKYLSGSAFNFGGLPLNRAKAIELLERPAGFDGFLVEVARANDALKAAGFQHPGLVAAAESYEISGAQVQLSAAAAAKLEASYKRYATTDKQVALLTELTTISDALNRLRSKEATGHSSITSFLEAAVKGWGYDGVGDARPNPDFILRYAN